jgi:hypothetical protein
VVPPNLEEQLILRRFVFTDSTVDVVDIRYSVGDLAIWASQDVSTIQIRVQVMGREPIRVLPLSDEERMRATGMEKWRGWWKPEHDRLLDLMLATARTIFAREDDIPDEIHLRGTPQPAWRAGGIFAALWGTEAMGYRGYLIEPDVSEGRTRLDEAGPLPPYRTYEETGKRLFLQFRGETDGETVAFVFSKSTGTSLMGGAAAKWFSEDPREHYREPAHQEAERDKETQ